MGSLRNTDFVALWASWAGVFRLGEPVLGTGSGFRWVPTGFAVPRFRFRRLRETEVSKVSLFDGLGSVPEVLTEPFLGTGFQESEVLRRFRAKVSDSYSVLRKCTLVL